MFAVLEFMNSDNEPAGEISIVPINWLRKNDTKCYWPTTTKRRNFSDFVKDETPYKSSWPCYKVYKVHLKTASYEHAEEMIEKLIANSIQSDSSSLSVTSNRSFMVKKVASKLDISSSSDSPSPRSSSKNRTKVEQTADVNLHTPKITTHNAYAKPVTPIRPATPISSDDEFFNQNLDRSNIQDTSVQNLSPIQNQNKSDTTNKKRFYNLDSETPRTKRVAPPNDEAPTSDQNKINHRNINYSSDNLSTATTVTNASFSSERSLEEVARHLSDIKNTLAQHSIMLNVLQNQAQLTNSGSLIPPPDLPDFPLKTFESFKQFEQSLQEDEAVRNYMIHRLAAIGGSGLDGLVRRILKFLISNEVAVLFNWKGREKHSFQTTKVMDIIYTAAKVNFPKNERNDLLIENSVKDWLKYAKVRISRKRN